MWHSYLGPDFISVEKFWFWAPVWQCPGPLKVKILKFLFLSVEPSKFDMTLIFGPWFYISWKILVRCPRLACPGPRKVKILKFLFLNVELSKFDMTLTFGPLCHISWNILVRGPRLTCPGPTKCQNFKIFVFECRTFKIGYCITSKNNQRSYLSPEDFLFHYLWVGDRTHQGGK